MWFARGVKFDDKAEDAHRDFSDDGAAYGPILMERRTWAIVIAKALSDATWWLINFWLPDFYRKEYGLTTSELAVPLAIAFFGSGAGALFAGWLSTRLLESGWSVNRVRKTIMFGIGGAYDLTLSKLRTQAGGAFELLFFADLVKRKKGVSNPRFFM